MLSERIDITSWPYHDKPHLDEGDELEVVPEPENEHDSEAVALYKGTRKVGYVPQELTWKVHRAIDAGSSVEATVVWPYKEELGIFPQVELTDDEERTRRREEREKTQKKTMGDGTKIIVYGLILIVCIAILWARIQSILG